MDPLSEQCGMDFTDLLGMKKDFEVVLFGTAFFAHTIYGILREFGINVVAACDNDEKKQGQMIGDLICESPKKIVPMYKDAIFCVTAIDYNVKRNIKSELIDKYGITENRVIFALNYYGTQYYESELFALGKDETFIDGGALDCGTCIQFCGWTQGMYKKIYSFEPDEINREMCISNIKKYNIKNIELIPYGLWDKKDVLSFVNARGGSCITENGCTSIQTTSIDETLNGKEASFIKMDIEGAELKALIGAKKTIYKYHPKLAISIYHKPEDLVELPMLIHNLSKEYKLYLRHYSSTAFETVLYAI